MLYRLPLILLAIFAFTMVTLPVFANQFTEEGTVVSAASGMLVIVDDAKSERSHSLGPTARIFINGRPGKVGELIKGMRVRVHKSNSGQVTSVSTVY